jgi:hypothetical protein
MIEQTRVGRWLGNAGANLNNKPYHEVGQRPPQPTHRPCGHDVELAPADTVQQGIQPRPLVAPPGARYALIAQIDQPSRPAASWSGCSWYSTVWPRSSVLTRTYNAARRRVRSTRSHPCSRRPEAMDTRRRLDGVHRLHRSPCASARSSTRTANTVRRSTPRRHDRYPDHPDHVIWPGLVLILVDWLLDWVTN